MKRLSGLFLLHLFCCAHFHFLKHIFFWLCFIPFIVAYIHLFLLNLRFIRAVFIYRCILYWFVVSFKFVYAYNYSLGAFFSFFISVRRAVSNYVRHASDIWCRYCKLPCFVSSLHVRRLVIIMFWKLNTSLLKLGKTVIFAFQYWKESLLWSIVGWHQRARRNGPMLAYCCNMFIIIIIIIIIIMCTSQGGLHVSDWFSLNGDLLLFHY